MRKTFLMDFEYTEGEKYGMDTFGVKPEEQRDLIHRILDEIVEEKELNLGDLVMELIENGEITGSMVVMNAVVGIKTTLETIIGAKLNE